LHLSLLSMNSLNKTQTAIFTLLLHLLLPGDHIARVYLACKSFIDGLIASGPGANLFGCPKRSTQSGLGSPSYAAAGGRRAGGGNGGDKCISFITSDPYLNIEPGVIRRRLTLDDYNVFSHIYINSI